MDFAEIGKEEVLFLKRDTISLVYIIVSHSVFNLMDVLLLFLMKLHFLLVDFVICLVVVIHMLM